MVFEVKGRCYRCQKEIKEKRQMDEKEHEELEAQLDQTGNLDYAQHVCLDCNIKLMIVDSVDLVEL